MGYNYFRISYYREYVEDIFALHPLFDKYHLTKERLRQKFVIAGKRMNHYMTVNGSPLMPAYTFYGFTITEHEKKLLARGFNGHFENTKWVKDHHLLVCQIIDFLDRMNKINDARYIPVSDKLNIRITEMAVDEIKSMENLILVLKRVEEKDLYANRLLNATLQVEEFQTIIAEELKINLNDLGYLEQFIKERSKIKPSKRANILSDFPISYYIIEFQELDISVRLFNSLCGSHIYHIRDLLLYSYRDIKSIRNLGPNTLLELDSLLNALGASFNEIYSCQSLKQVEPLVSYDKGEEPKATAQ
jgi:hypothetical protein